MLKRKAANIFDADDDYNFIDGIRSVFFFLFSCREECSKAELKFEQFLSQKVSAQKVCFVYI